MIAAPTIAAARSIAAVSIAKGIPRRGRGGVVVDAHGGGSMGGG
jgi:hypothetical protein